MSQNPFSIHFWISPFFNWVLFFSLSSFLCSCGVYYLVVFVCLIYLCIIWPSKYGENIYRCLMWVLLQLIKILDLFLIPVGNGSLVVSCRHNFFLLYILYLPRKMSHFPQAKRSNRFGIVMSNVSRRISFNVI